MFFRKHSEPRPAAERSSSAPATGSPQLTILPSGAAISAGDDVALGQVLDAMGGVLSALARFPLELPDKPAEEITRELTAWQRHATLGYAVAEGAAAATPAVGVRERDWEGLVRTVTAHRREEHRHVTAAITELRDALWSCVETVHRAVQTDQQTDETASVQMERARGALERLQAGSIKAEVLSAVSVIEEALESRRVQHQQQYVSLATKIDRMGRQLEEARRETTTDPLTGLGNRRLFELMAARAIQMHSLARQPVALLMVDLDKLKLVNDMYGHPAGDAAIVSLGRALSKVFLRGSDSLCRIGGDEFAVLLPNTDWKIAQTLARRLQEQIAELPTPHPAMEFQIGASVGVAQLEPFEELDEWVARADKALYKAKGSGRDRVCVAESTIIPITRG